MDAHIDVCRTRMCSGRTGGADAMCSGGGGGGSHPETIECGFCIAACQSEGRPAVCSCQLPAMPPKDNKGNIDASASSCGFQFLFMSQLEKKGLIFFPPEETV